MGNRIFLLSVIAIAGGMFWNTFFFRKTLVGATSSPSGVPRIILAGIIITALLILIRDWKKGLPAHVRELFQGTRLYLVIALPVYLLALPWLGYTISTFLLLFTLFCLLANDKPTAKGLFCNALFSCLLSAGVFILFRQIFHIQLPTLPIGF